MADAELEALWATVTEHWDQAKAHDAFLQRAHDSGQLGQAAAKYRLMLEDPARRELAQKRLNAVAILAMQTLDAHRSTPVRKLPRWLVASAALSCAGGIAWLLYAIFS